MRANGDLGCDILNRELIEWLVRLESLTDVEAAFSIEYLDGRTGRIA